MTSFVSLAVNVIISLHNGQSLRNIFVNIYGSDVGTRSYDEHWNIIYTLNIRVKLQLSLGFQTDVRAAVIVQQISLCLTRLSIG